MNDPQFKFKELVEDNYREVVNIHMERMLRSFKKKEESLFSRKAKTLIVKDTRKRRVWTPWGDLWLYRRRYFDKESQTYRYLLDEHLNLESRNYVPEEYRLLALKNFHSFKSYKEIAETTFNGKVSKQSIHNFIKHSKPSEEFNRGFYCPDGVLNINIDGIFIKKNVQSVEKWEIKKRRSAAFHIKSFLFFTHSEAVSKNRNKLQGRIMKYFVEETAQKQISQKQVWENEDTMTKELDKIIALYDNVKEIRVIGDGARWIKSIAGWIGGSYIADKFHMRKYVRDLLGRQRYHLGLILINKKISKDKLRNRLYRLVANPSTGEVSKENIRLIGYIVNNHKHYLLGVKTNSISAIEGIQAHYISKFFKRQRKGWCKETLSNIIISLTNKFNSEVYYR